MVYFFGDSGNEPILFLHGWGSSSHAFFCLKNFFEKRYYLIMPDFSGFGDAPAPKRAMSVEDYARETIELLNKLNLKKVHIVCHSFGARVAIKINALWPELIDKLVIVGGAGMKPRRSLLTRFKIWRYKRQKRKRAKLGLPPPEVKAGSDYASVSGVMRETFVKVVNENQEKEAKQILAETLLVWGEKDKDTPLYMAKRLRKLIKKSKIIVYKNSGHFCYLENLTDFCYDISKFLLGE